MVTAKQLLEAYKSSSYASFLPATLEDVQNFLKENAERAEHESAIILVEFLYEYMLMGWQG